MIETDNFLMVAALKKVVVLRDDNVWLHQGYKAFTLCVLRFTDLAQTLKCPSILQGNLFFAKMFLNC
jgi:hypothetical protein